MTTEEPLDDEEFDESLGRPCAECGHAEADHALEDVEGEQRSAVRCLECEDWHEFVPTPLRE